VTCPKCGGPATREVETMDTFVDSSWYFLRYPDVNNDKEFASKEAMNKWMPVDLYVGGAEHTVLHLLYSRFFTKVLFDLGYVKFDEPFTKLRHQGTILAEDGRKMSKRWGNVINPDDEINKYGADTLRVYEMFMGPFPDSKPWNTKGEVGVYRFINKVWEMKDKIVDEDIAEQNRQINKTTKKISSDIENLSFNTAVAKFMELANYLSKEEKISRKVWENYLKIMAPFAPFITEELWSQLGNTYSIHQQTWPEYDESLIQDDTVKIAVQVNGKVRSFIEIDFDSEEKDAVEKAMRDANIKKYVATEPKKIIFVKNKILNIII
jgi:leucyl-tRNA synthetase